MGIQNKIAQYRACRRGVSHCTFNPEGPGVVRIHLLPPKFTIFVPGTGTMPSIAAAPVAAAAAVPALVPAPVPAAAEPAAARRIPSAPKFDAFPLPNNSDPCPGEQAVPRDFVYARDLLHLLFCGASFFVKRRYNRGCERKVLSIWNALTLFATW